MLNHLKKVPLSHTAEVSQVSRSTDMTKPSSGTTPPTAVSTKEERGKDDDYVPPVPAKDVGVLPTPPPTPPVSVSPSPPSTPRSTPPSKRTEKDPSPDADNVYGNVSEDQLVSKPIKVQESGKLCTDNGRKSWIL